VAVERLLQCEWSYPLAKVFIHQIKGNGTFQKISGGTTYIIKPWLPFSLHPLRQANAQQATSKTNNTTLAARLLDLLVDLEDGGSMFL
jgi:hypothetical protein